MTKDVQDRMVAIAQVRDAFRRAVWVDGDVEAALALVTEDCMLEIVSSGVRAAGREGLRRFLRDDVLPHRPDDVAFRRLSRTTDRWRVVTEEMVSFTHDRELPWLLPGVAPTGRRVEALAISVVTVPRGGLLIGAHRTLWDYASLASLRLGTA